MKKIFLLLLFILPICLSAQHKYGSVKFGLFTPSATDGGFIIGYEGGWNIDDRFLFGWSADWFHKNYVDASLVKQYDEFYGNIHSQLNEIRATTNLHSIPLMGTITGSWDVSPRVRAFASGSAGINVLLIFYRNYDSPDQSEFQAAFDFAWRLGGGLIYELGERSDAILELDYHNSQPSLTYDVKDSSTGRKKTFERKFDMSGMMLRVGFRFYF